MKALNIIIIAVSITSYSVEAQPSIGGKLHLDSIWEPIVYLSYIPSLDKMYNMSYNIIIEETKIDSNGKFSFNTTFLPAEDRFYRIHITKKGYPPASLIIGGKEENHFFLIANKTSEIVIGDKKKASFLSDITVNGYYPNQLLHQINDLTLSVDTASFAEYPVKKEFIQKALYEKLRVIADTTSHPLVSLFALYKTNFEADNKVNPFYYQKYLNKWENEHSSYFNEFRKRFSASGNNEWLNRSIIGLAFLAIGIFGYHFTLKFKNFDKNLIKELTVQERKIYKLLQSGKSNKEISNECNIGLSTVKTHVNNIFTKLNVSSRKDVVNID